MIGALNASCGYAWGTRDALELLLDIQQRRAGLTLPEGRSSDNFEKELQELKDKLSI